MKIAVYAIAKNEEKHVERFCESANDADLIVIGDTGSTDKTVYEIRRMSGLFPRNDCKIFIHDIWISPWRFDMARNAVLALLPQDIDVCVSLDLDEVLQPGWREEIERVWKVGETTRLGYMFNWGGPVEFRYTKIHARHGYRWHHPCHEYPREYGIQEVYAETSKLLVVHQADPTKSRQQYLNLLKWSIEEDSHCPRNAFYYAREHSFGYEGCDLNEALRQCDRYLSLPGATWPNERSYAYRVKGGCYEKLGDLASAEKAWHLSAQEAPETREPWLGLAGLMRTQNRWPECYAYAMRALSLQHKEKLYTTDHSAWGSKPYLYACLGAWYIGLQEKAIEYGQEALKLEPNSSLLQENLRVMLELVGHGRSISVIEAVHGL